MAHPAQQPAVLVVTGAWHIPEHYTALTTALTNAGFLTICPLHPSMNADKPGARTLWDDTANIHSLAADLVSKGHPLLVLCHSYGGSVTTNALTQDLSLTERHDKGLPGGIVSLVYMCAFMPQIGISIVNIVEVLPGLLKSDVDKEGNVFPVNPVEAFYGGVPKEVADKSVAMMLKQPVVCHTAETKHAAWMYFPVTFLYCEHDMAIVLECQQYMVSNAQDAGSPALRTETVDTSHSPFLTMPGDMVAAVKRAWDAAAPATLSEASV